MKPLVCKLLPVKLRSMVSAWVTDGMARSSDRKTDTGRVRHFNECAVDGTRSPANPPWKCRPATPSRDISASRYVGSVKGGNEGSNLPGSDRQQLLLPLSRRCDIGP